MNLNPATVLDPVFHFLDEAIVDYGFICISLVWLSLILIAWIFSGGLRLKYPDQPRISVGIIIRPHAPPPPPIIIHEFDPLDDDTD